MSQDGEYKPPGVQECKHQSAAPLFQEPQRLAHCHILRGVLERTCKLQASSGVRPSVRF